MCFLQFDFCSSAPCTETPRMSTEASLAAHVVVQMASHLCLLCKDWVAMGSDITDDQSECQCREIEIAAFDLESYLERHAECKGISQELVPTVTMLMHDLRNKIQCAGSATEGSLPIAGLTELVAKCSDIADRCPLGDADNWARSAGVLVAGLLADGDCVSCGAKIQAWAYRVLEPWLESTSVYHYGCALQCIESGIRDVSMPRGGEKRALVCPCMFGKHRPHLDGCLQRKRRKRGPL